MHHLSRHSARLGRLRRSSAVLTALALTVAAAACGPGQTPGAPTTTAGTSSTAATTSGPLPTSETPTTTQRTTTPPAPTTTRPAPTRTAKPTPQPERVYAVVLRPGDSGPKVRDLQARLRQIGWYHADVTDYYGSRTTEAIRGFQQKRGFPVTGVTDERTYNRLLAMTRPPTRDELNNVKPAPSRSSWDVDKRCLTGRVICISKSTRSLTWVIDGTAQYSMDVRFGNEAQPTREGTFFIYKKQVDVISNIYFTPMPYSMFFSGGQAIHYSSDFARLGYNGSSHGCVNVRDWDGIVRLYNAAPVGTKVVIHW